MRVNLCVTRDLNVFCSTNYVKAVEQLLAIILSAQTGANLLADVDSKSVPQSAETSSEMKILWGEKKGRKWMHPRSQDAP